MTRIGFAYNQKPDAPAGLVCEATSDSRGDEEPPSSDDVHHNVHRDVLRDGASDGASDVYAEWDSADTIDAVAAALSACGEVIRLEANASFPERLRALRPDIVFNIAEGLHGINREAHVPAICEFFGVPYSGSDPYTLSLCLHKARTKDALTAAGIPNAPFALIESDADIARLLGPRSPLAPGPTDDAPLFLKPVHEGSSKGITERNFVRSPSELETQAQYLLATYRQPVIAEAFLSGAEFTCGVLGNGASARVLPLVAMNFASLPSGALPIYGFEAKWLWDRAEEPLEIFECPPQIDAPLQRAVEQVALAAYRALGCRDWSRVDVRLDARGVPNVVEVNPLPGILPRPEDNSCLPKAARAAGLSYDGLIQCALQHAAARYGIALDTHASPESHLTHESHTPRASRPSHASTSTRRAAVA